MGIPPPVEEATIVNRLLVYGLPVVLAVLVAGLYGVVHNQLNYTVSPKYFTKFKCSRLGSVLGVVVGWTFQLAVRFRTKAQAH